MSTTNKQPTNPVARFIRWFFYRGRGDSPFKTLLIHATLIIACIIAVYPVLRVVTISLRPNDTLLTTDLRIIPNPVAANTQLRCTLASEGRVRLEVSDAMGRMIEVLEEGQRGAGEFTHQWNTSGLAPGTYVLRSQADVGLPETLEASIRVVVEDPSRRKK